MKLAVAAYAITLLSLTAPLATSSEPPEAAAESAARAWLVLVDVGNYAERWSAASTLFQQPKGVRHRQTHRRKHLREFIVRSFIDSGSYNGVPSYGSRSGI